MPLPEVHASQPAVCDLPSLFSLPGTCVPFSDECLAAGRLGLAAPGRDDIDNGIQDLLVYWIEPSEIQVSTRFKLSNLRSYLPLLKVPPSLIDDGKSTVCCNSKAVTFSTSPLLDVFDFFFPFLPRLTSEGGGLGGFGRAYTRRLCVVVMTS